MAQLTSSTPAARTCGSSASWMSGSMTSTAGCSQLQIDGAKTGLELPGIVDEVVTLAELKADDGSPYRAFVCHTVNPWGYPAKDRSGRLDQIEEPHLGRLMAKITGPVKPARERLTFGGRDHTTVTQPTPTVSSEPNLTQQGVSQ